MSSRFDKMIKDFVDSIKENKKETGPYDTTATVIRIEENMAYVHIPGGIEETPVSKTIDCKIGDIVQLRVGGGRAWIVGNATAPPTDDTTAIKASGTATKFITDMVDGIFVHPENDKKNGVKVTDGVYIIRDGKIVAVYGDVTKIGDESGKHLFLDKDSIELKDGKKMLTKYDGTGVVLYDNDTEIAKFYNNSMGYGSVVFHTTAYENSDTEVSANGASVNLFGDDTIGQQYASSVNTNGVYKSRYAFDGIYNNNTNYPVGTFRNLDYSGAPQTTSGTWYHVNMGSLEDGTWLVTFGGSFDANGSGDRMILLSTSDDTIVASRHDLISRASANNPTILQGARILRLSATTEIYLHFYQNSGSSLFIHPALQAIKLV